MSVTDFYDGFIKMNIDTRQSYTYNRELTGAGGRSLGIYAIKRIFLIIPTIILVSINLTLCIYGINVFGDAVRDLLDPGLRGGIGKKTSPGRESPTQSTIG